MVSDEEFETIKLDDNPSWVVRIYADFPPTMRKRLFECLRANYNLFAISPDEMLSIDPSVVCHQLNVDRPV